MQGESVMENAIKVALVTGGARGIGRATAEWFLRHGYKVGLWDIDRPTLDRTVAELADAARVLGTYCDVSKPKT
jgi:NAD(P)-dependent dehydrogenase (short-subunit alcohol dehydrogenase family)